MRKLISALLALATLEFALELFRDATAIFGSDDPMNGSLSNLLLAASTVFLVGLFFTLVLIAILKLPKKCDDTSVRFRFFVTIGIWLLTIVLRVGTGMVQGAFFHYGVLVVTP